MDLTLKVRSALDALRAIAVLEAFRVFIEPDGSEDADEAKRISGEILRIREPADLGTFPTGADKRPVIPDESKPGAGFAVNEINAVLWGINEPLSSAQMAALNDAARERAKGGKWRPTDDEIRAIQKKAHTHTGGTNGAETRKPADPPPPAKEPDPPPPPVKFTGEVPNESDLTRDKNGRTWDARIHSPTPTILKTTGLFKRKRNISEDLVANVFAEQDARDAAMREAAASAADAPPPPPAEPPKQETTGTAAPTPDAPPPPPSENPVEMPFADLMIKVAQSGKTTDEVTKHLSMVGCGTLADLAKQPVLVATVHALIFHGSE